MYRYFLLFIVFIALNSCNTTHVPDLEEITISEIHNALKNEDCSCKDIVQSYLKRIEKYNKPEGINALSYINENALKEADKLDSLYKSTGMLSPLFCIPIIVKDNYDVMGFPTTAGSIALKESFPPDDAHQIKLLKDAGVIILAKSNMAEWAFSPMMTISSTMGETRNPYNLEHTTAGSSGGTAAAVAANLGTIGLGTDTGNSIRGPSSHNALVGFRTSMGLISRDGIVPLFLNNDIGGPMGRTVEDATKIMEVLAGFDPKDPITQHGQGKIQENYQQFLKKDGLNHARIGVFRQLSDKDTHPGVKELFEAALVDMKNAGATVIDVEIPEFDSLRANLWCTMFWYDVNNYFKSLGPNAPIKNIEKVLEMDVTSEYIKERFRDRVYTHNTPDSCADTFTHPGKIAYREAFEKLMDSLQLDAIVYPTWNHPPAKIGDFEGYLGDNSQIIAPNTGMPAFTIPMGYTTGNLPAGIQFLGRIFDEPTLVRLTYSYEQNTTHRKPPVLD